MKITRRSLLGGAAGAAALTALPQSVQRALAAPAKPGRLADIEHVVIFMQENRAFEHYYGTMKGVRGFGDRAAIRGVNGRSLFHQPDASRKEGFLAPYPMNGQHTNAFCQGAPAFGFADSMGAWNDGIADGYVSRRGSGALGQGFYTADDMPFYHALANAFTIGDQYYAGMQTSTNPNRMFFMTGTTGGTVQDTARIDNSYISGGFTWKTYAERLQDAGISWKHYQAQDNFDDNALLWFGPFQKAKAGEPLYDRGVFRAGRSSDSGDAKAMGDALVAQFTADVAGGTLPQVSWICAPAALSEHANYRPPAGEQLTARLIAALADHPEVWEKTAFILNYDEHGGFFDHALPPVPPLGAGRGKSDVTTDGEIAMRTKTASGAIQYRIVNQEGRYKVGGAFVDALPAGETVQAGPFPLGLGTRVPLIVVSPWTRGGNVCSEVFDHTSVLQFLEKRFGVEEPNISPWRRAICGDLTSVFDFSGNDTTLPLEGLPDTSAYWDQANANCALPGVTVPSPQQYPVQDSGVKPARPVPYALETRGRIVDGRLELTFRNQGSAAAVFAGYPQPGRAPKHWTVSAHQDLVDTWDTGDAHDVRVHGPNGYLWHHRGAGEVPDVQIREDGTALEISVKVRKDVTLLVGDLAYGGGELKELKVTRADGQVVLRVPVAAHGWYDVAVTDAADPRFLRRAAGKLAARAGGVTDPAMGQINPLAVTVDLVAATSTIDEAVVIPGTATRVTTTVTNNATVPLADVTALLTVPAGWKVSGSQPKTTLAPGQVLKIDWQVTPPAGTSACGTQPLLSALAVGRTGDGLRIGEGHAPVRVAVSVAGGLLGEDFESLAPLLKPKVKLPVAADVIGWTATPPQGWTVVNAPGMPVGTPELQGWSFMTKRFFANGGQDRANFTRGLGIVAVADPDDWDDLDGASKRGKFDSTLVSPAVAIPAGAAQLFVGFDSHYRQEDPQRAQVVAEFDDGATVTLLSYGPNVAGNENKGGDVQNAYISRTVAVPAGATTVRLRFRMFDAGNNWFWAVDHIRLSDRPLAAC